MYDSPPPSTYVPVVPRAVPDWPCPHNQWDNLRMRKGVMMLRCRCCGESWKVFRPAPCNDFFKFQSCPLGDNCPRPHIYKTRHSGLCKEPDIKIASTPEEITVEEAASPKEYQSRVLPLSSLLLPPSALQPALTNYRGGAPNTDSPLMRPSLNSHPFFLDSNPSPNKRRDSLESPLTRMMARSNGSVRNDSFSTYSHNPYNAEVLSPTTLVMKGLESSVSLNERDLPSMGLSALRAPQSPLIASGDTFALPPPSPPIRGVPAPIHSTPSVQPLPTSPIFMYQHQGVQGTPGPQHLPLPSGLIHSSLSYQPGNAYGLQPLQHQGQWIMVNNSGISNSGISSNLSMGTNAALAGPPPPSPMQYRPLHSSAHPSGLPAPLFYSN